MAMELSGHVHSQVATMDSMDGMNAGSQAQKMAWTSTEHSFILSSSHPLILSFSHSFILPSFHPIMPNKQLVAGR
jgi:hypothetical protein